MKKILLTLVLALSFSIPAFAEGGNTPISGRGGNTPISGATGDTPIVDIKECALDEQCPIDNDVLDEIGDAIIDIIFGLG